MQLRSTLLSLWLFITVVVSAQSGYLDITFAGTGFIVEDIGNKSYDGVTQVLVQQDQKLLAVGSSSVAEITLARYLLDGTPDPDFGSNGRLRLRFGGHNSSGYAVDQQPDGKLLIAGVIAKSGGQDWAVMRLHLSGQIDSTFGTNGSVITDIVDGYESPQDIAIQPDGKIVLVGSIPTKTFSDMAVLRYTKDGQLDADFGSNGIVITNFRGEDVAYKVIIQPDEKILVGGFSSESAVGDFAMARYNADGDLDETFGDDGRVMTDFEQGSDWARSMELLPDGKIIMAGNVNYRNLEFLSEFGLAKYNADGSLDSTFAVNGKSIFREGTKTDANAMVVQPDGKIIIAGTSDFPTSQLQWFLTRILPTGERDVNFGDNGIVITDIPGSNEYGYTMALSRDSRIYIGGSVFTGSHTDNVVTRYVADFVIDNVIIEHPSCPGVNDASVTIELSGGTPPYIFTILPFPGEPLPEPGGPGTFLIQITDATGASGVFGPYVILAPPPAPVVTIEVIEDQIVVHADGVGLYLYSLDGGVFAASNVFTEVPDGVHTVDVIDENGCIVSVDNILVEATSVEADFSKIHIRVFPNPNQGDLAIEVIGERITTIEVYDALGKKMSYHSQKNGEQWQLQIEYALPGMYWLILDFESGKQGLKAVMLE
jgi:uncharacterized delta-60 repeat protein